MWIFKRAGQSQPVALITLVSHELVLITSIQEHIFSLFEVAEQSFESDGLLLYPLFFFKLHKQFFFLILLLDAVLDS